MLALCFFPLLLLCGLNSAIQKKEISKEEQEKLVQYLKTHWSSPEELQSNAVPMRHSSVRILQVQGELI